MTEAAPPRRRDPLTDRMCRDTDVLGSAAWMMHFLILFVVFGGAIWTFAGIRHLREDTERWNTELVEFRKLADQAARSPRRELARVAKEFGRRIAAQTWHRNLPGVRARVLETASGVRLRFTRTIPAGTEQGSEHPVTPVYPQPRLRKRSPGPGPVPPAVQPDPAGPGDTQGSDPGRDDGPAKRSEGEPDRGPAGQKVGRGRTAPPGGPEALRPPTKGRKEVFGR